MKKDKILVVVPKYNNSINPNYFYMFPVGYGYVVAAMLKAKLPIDVINLNHMSGKSSALIESYLNKGNYHILCSGGNSLIYDELKSIISAAKKHPSKPLTVLGGSIITTEPELIFRDIQPDYGVIGEAENIIADLLFSLLNGESPQHIPGVIFEHRGEIIKNQPLSIQNLDNLSFPAMELLGYEEWLENTPSNNSLNAIALEKPRLYPILASRDCPFHCTFCYHYGKYRERSLDNIFLEINDAVKKYQINYIVFYDECFSLKPERVKEFCKRINNLRSKIDWDLQWGVQLTVKGVNEELCSLLKESGCNSVAYGFESYDQKILKSMQKPITPIEIDNALKLALKYNFVLYALFIFGDTEETTETYKETLEYWKKNAEGQVRLDMIRLFPGSKIYEDSFKRGLFKDKISFIQNEMIAEEPINFTKNMSEIEYQEMFMDICHARRCYIKHVIPKSVIHSNKYSKVYVKCPFCKKEAYYDNVLLPSHYRFSIEFICRYCLRRFNIISRISWLWMHFKIFHYALIKLIGVKRLWRFKFLFRGLTHGR
ncbi:MAG TPA: radical SAM protein [Victivallales bacterium]|nr:radical SAM protein [Victivallales bacterium]